MGSSRFTTRWLSLALAILLLNAPAFGANVCDPVTGTDCVGIDPDRNLKQAEYDRNGRYRGKKSTYSAGTNLKTATAAGVNAFFSICGSSSKVIRIQRVLINGTVATAAVYGDVVLKRTSTATSGGTATALTQLPRDPSDGAGTAALVNYYTVLATPGTSAGVVSARSSVFPITATVAASMAALDFDFRDSSEADGPVLRSTAQCLEANFGTTTTNAPTLHVSVTWTEEDPTTGQ